MKRALILFSLLSILLNSSPVLTEELLKEELLTDEIVDQKKSDTVNFGIGASVMYAMWRPPWERYKFDVRLPLHVSPEINPALLYGPIFSLSFNDKWKLNTIFTYGRYRAEKNIAFPFLIAGSVTAKAHRFNLDITLDYIINRYIKLFTGINYLGYKLTINFLRTYNMNLYNIGPDIGVGFTLSIFPSLYFLTNISGIFMGGQENGKTAVSAGCNIGATLAYHIAAIKTTISLGGKFQYLKYIRQDNSLYFRDKDEFFGMIFSFVYAF